MQINFINTSEYLQLKGLISEGTLDALNKLKRKIDQNITSILENKTVPLSFDIAAQTFIDILSDSVDVSSHSMKKLKDIQHFKEHGSDRDFLLVYCCMPWFLAYHGVKIALEVCVHQEKVSLDEYDQWLGFSRPSPLVSLLEEIEKTQDNYIQLISFYFKSYGKYFISFDEEKLITEFCIAQGNLLRTLFLLMGDEA